MLDTRVVVSFVKNIAKFFFEPNVRSWVYASEMHKRNKDVKGNKKLSLFLHFLKCVVFHIFILFYCFYIFVCIL